jgi:glycerol-3-phosphate acyltransferase PlsX
MDPTRNVSLAVDAVGGDHAPGAILEGVAAALRDDPHLTVLLVGPAEVVEPFATAHERCTPVPATEIIGMGEHPAQSVRSKKDSSIVVGCRLVRGGEAGGFFSAGNTGAMMAASLLVMGRIRGVARPAIAGVMPTTGPPVVMLDIGANADCKAEHLVQFAHMGAAYSRAVVGVAEPRVALLNIGEEPSKGSQLAVESHGLMAAQVPGFTGNVEGRDIPCGAADVIVTDGFTGNVVLKLMEGLSKMLLGEVKDAMTSSPINKLAAAVVAPSLRAMKVKMDPDAYGAAPLLGIDGLSLIGHGSSNATAVASALRHGARAVREDLVAQIAAAVASSPEVAP